MFGLDSSPIMFSSHLATSPNSLSIYDQERSDIQSSYCGGTYNLASKFTTEAISLEEPILDDKYEESNLKSVLTPDFLNSLSVASSSLPPSVQWEAKTSGEESESNANLTLNEINMDSDIAFLDIFNYDTDDSKMSFPPLDLLTSELKSSNSSSCHTPVPVMSDGPISISTNPETFLDQENKGIMMVDELRTPKVEGEAKSIISDQSTDCYRKTQLIKSNFPRRETPPSLIGIVTPVRKPNVLETPVLKEQKPDILELKSYVFNSKNSMEDARYSKCMNTDATVAYSFNEMAPQTVPCGSLKRVYEKVKSEPDSPSSKKQCMDASDDYEDLNSMAEVKREVSIRPQRRRYDSGGSGHISDGADDEFMRDLDDSDDDDDYSDIDADITTTGCESLIDTGKKQKQFFWQYNVQAKGPKGTRLKLAVDSPKDPHILNNFEDPVFDECNTVVAGIRHGGKARKGDGNEITPNPKKLVLIGQQLLRLNKRINSFQLGSDVPLSKRNESRKEKNKLASRACRLKKKAQHEANKIKLHGLEEEHTQLNSVVQEIWPKLRDQAKALLKHGQLDSGSANNSRSLTSTLDNLITNTLKAKAAKGTTDYVNNVILKVEAGDSKGGLNIRSRKT